MAVLGGLMWFGYLVTFGGCCVVCIFAVWFVWVLTCLWIVIVQFLDLWCCWLLIAVVGV